jgi:hypothetical protein
MEVTTDGARECTRLLYTRVYSRTRVGPPRLAVGRHQTILHVVHHSVTLLLGCECV